MADKRAKLVLEQAIAEGLPDGTNVRRVWDPLATAVYQLEPTWCTAVICIRCLHIGLIPTLPSKSPHHWTCSQCGARIPLEPPREVLEATPAGRALIVPGDRRGRRLS